MLHEYTPSEDNTQQKIYDLTANFTREQILGCIINDAEACIDPPIRTLERLRDCGFLASPDELATVFVAGFRALSQEGV